MTNTNVEAKLNPQKSRLALPLTLTDGCRGAGSPRTAPRSNELFMIRVGEHLRRGVAPIPAVELAPEGVPAGAGMQASGEEDEVGEGADDS